MTRPTREKERTLERLFELIDEQVEARGKAFLAELDATENIAELAGQARVRGATMPQLVEHVKRMDRNTRKLRPVTPQAINRMLAVHEIRRT